MSVPSLLVPYTWPTKCCPPSSTWYTIEPPRYSTPSSLQPVAPCMSVELLTETITRSPSLSGPLYMNIPHLIRQEVPSTADTHTLTHTPTTASNKSAVMNPHPLFLTEPLPRGDTCDCNSLYQGITHAICTWDKWKGFFFNLMTTWCDWSFTQYGLDFFRTSAFIWFIFVLFGACTQRKCSLILSLPYLHNYFAERRPIRVQNTYTRRVQSRDKTL
jgi:hypothetical protein